MAKEIIINSTPNEVRVAVQENGNTIELFIERTKNKNVAGNIYKGKVVKVLPGMQSAFIEIGLPKAAFLHVADLYTENGDTGAFMEEHVDERIETNETPEKPEEHVYAPIEQQLKEGQELVVQVAKEAIGAKGARLTTHLTVPGRYLVLMPGYEHIGVSRKIEEEAERDRLRDILKEIKPSGMGLIARTVSEKMSQEDLQNDLDYLCRMWDKITEQMNALQAPAQVYGDHDLIFRLLRDITTNDIDRIIIDSKSDFLKMRNFIREYLPNLSVETELYENDIPIFDFYNIEIEISRILDKKVWLKSGGYIVIDQAEALTVIDVNTGKYVGKRNFEETILKTNLEAAKEIAAQLKLRNIGGIIIVDFIDMEKEEHKTKVLSTLEQELKNDRAKASVVNITPLGLVEITRKRVQESLARVLSEPCPHCDGRGVIKSKITLCHDILRETRRIAPFHRKAVIFIEAHPDVAEMLMSYDKESIDELELMFDITIEIKPNHGYHHEHYELIPLETM